MTPREILQKMLGWIAEEKRKSTQPGGDPFEYMSLTYCASEVGAGEQLGEVVKLLQKSVKAEPPCMPFDAMRHNRAIFLINRTLATSA